VIILPEAEADLADAQAYYDRQRDGLGAEFLHSVEGVLEQVDRMPEAHAVVHEGVRRALTRRFPFSIYDRVEGDEVVVLAVLHSRRDAKRWQSRL
jgi:toxin ParE1/3/4